MFTKFKTILSKKPFRKLKKRPKKIKEKQKNKMTSISLQHKLIGSLIIFASLPVIIVSILSFQANTQAIENSVGSYSQRIIQQFGNSFNNIIDQSNNLLTSFMNTNFEIKELILIDNSKGNLSISWKNLQINGKLRQILQANNMINGIIALNDQDEVYHHSRGDLFKETMDNFSAKEFFNSPLAEEIKNSPDPVWFTSITGEESGNYVAYNYSSHVSSVKGIIIISVDMRQANELINSVHIEGVSRFFIMDKDCNIAESTQKERVGEVFEEAYKDDIFEKQASDTFIHSGKLVSYYTLKNGWKAVYDAPLNSLMGDVIKARNTTLAVAIICILLAIFIGYLIATSIARPIQKLSEVMAEAETGNLGVEYAYDSNNEIGRLVRSFNQMISNIKGLIFDTKTVAETIEANTQTLETVSVATATSANQITQAIESVASGTESQTVQVANSSQMMTNLAENINLATDKVQGVQEVANSTMEVSNETVTAMADLTSQTEETVKISGEIERHIEELGHEAEQITNVIGMIQSISEQTNLLALNAAIEAARAGEAGRGFGVVADEIRKLANESSQATTRIEEIIASIMEKKDISIQGAREATSLFNLQKPIVEHTNEAFEKIHEEMDRVVIQLDELRDLFGEITQNKDDTVASIKEIEEIIGHSASAAQEVFATSQEQSASAEEIENMVLVLSRGVEELKAAQEKFSL